MSFARNVKRNKSKKQLHGNVLNPYQAQKQQYNNLAAIPMPQLGFGQDTQPQPTMQDALMDFQRAYQDGYADGFSSGNRHGLENGAMYVMSCTDSALKNTSGIGAKRANAMYEQIMDNFNTEESFENYRKQDQDMFKLRLIKNDIYQEMSELRDAIKEVNETLVNAGHLPLTIGDIKTMLNSFK